MASLRNWAAREGRAREGAPGPKREGVPCRCLPRLACLCLIHPSRGQRSRGPSPPHLAGGAVPRSCVRRARRPAQPPRRPTPWPGSVRYSHARGWGGESEAGLLKGQSLTERGGRHGAKGAAEASLDGCKRSRFACGAGLLQTSGCLSVSVFLVYAYSWTRSPVPPRSPGQLPPTLSRPLSSLPDVGSWERQSFICVFSSTCPQLTTSPGLPRVAPPADGPGQKREPHPIPSSPIPIRCHLMHCTK